MTEDFKKSEHVKLMCMQYAKKRIGELKALVFCDEVSGETKILQWKVEDVYEAIKNRKHEYNKALKRKQSIQAGMSFRFNLY